MASTPLPDALRGLELDHVAVAVPDVEGSAAWAALGLERVGEDEFLEGEGVRVRTFAAGAVLVELIAPLGDASSLTRFLERRGPGLHHLALRVHDIAAAMATLAEHGASFIQPAPRPGRSGSLVAFVHPSWTGGTLVELVEHA